MAQTLWQPLETSGLPSGFPRQPSVLTAVQVNGSEFLAAVGSSPGGEEKSSSSSSGELTELCIGMGAASPTDLWARPLQAACVVEASKPSSPDKKKPLLEGEELPPFQRTVLAFPPRPRKGFTLTPLDGSGCRFFLFGGHTGHSGKPGHCLADSRLLEFIDSLDEVSSPSSCSSGSESEDIFFASDYKVVLKERSAKNALPVAPSMGPKVTPNRMRNGAEDDCSSRDSSESELDDRSPAGARAEAFEKTLRETVMHLGSSTKVKMSRKKASPAKTKVTKALRPISVSESGARWRLPQQQEGAAPSPRVGHVAVLQPPLHDGMHPSILIHGGLDDGGMPLGDTYEVRVIESTGQPLKTEWHCVDPGERGVDGPAPWEQEQTPRARACHSGVFWKSEPQSYMVIFGGLTLGLEGEPRPLGDTWMLMRPAVEGTAAGSWRRPVMQGGAPARRWGHSCCLAGSSHSAAGMMLVCGGVDSAGKALSDCWALYLDEMRWELVETAAMGSPLCRPLLPASSFMSSGEDTRCPQPELGRCTATWSFSLGAAVVWSSQGFWTCHVPDRQLSSVSPQRQRASAVDKKQRGEQKLGTSEMQAQWWEQQKVKPKDDSRQSGGKNSSMAFSGLPDVLSPSQVAFSGLPDVHPPPRNSRWAQKAPRDGGAPSLLRVHSEPRLHDSWLVAAPLARSPGSQGNLLDAKAMGDRPPLDAAVQWHAKHTQSRLFE